MGRFICTFGMGLVVAMVSGCATKAPLGRVEGVVTLDGKPLPKVEVQFLPDPSAGASARRSLGYTDDQGRFSLRTDDGEVGAAVCNHRVCLIDVVARTHRRGEMKKSRIPPQYGNATQTPLTAISVTEGEQSIEIKVDRNRR
ncbi:MAG: hypothetical protein C0467_31560 [Planctomycetaceae bacterium]|nr:hypothetical protein [Planctomycetaceae bacterium]